MLPARWRVLEARAETAGVRTLALAPLEGSSPGWAPGQFNMLYAFGVGEAAISICGDPGDPAAPMLHTIRQVGATTRALTGLEPGAMVGLRGPFGTGWPLDGQRGRHLLLIAGGLGLAPLRPVVLAAIARPHAFAGLSLLTGARSPEALLYACQLDRWRCAGLTLHATVDHAGRDWTGRVGLVTRLLPEALAGADPAQVSAFICGPEVMMRFTAEALAASGVPTDRLWLSMERTMQCAIGQCGRCQFGPDFICRDGPVLRYERMAARLRVREL
jgi:NAD(P)H-flavin reductase